MSDIFLRSDAKPDQAIAECTDPERIREITKAHYAALGVISRERGQDWGALLLRQPEPIPDATLPANGFKYEKEVRFHPESGRRALLIRANTLEDLIALENQIVGQ